MSFDLVEVDIVYADSGSRYKPSTFINKEEFVFVFVAETYDENIHK